MLLCKFRDKEALASKAALCCLTRCLSRSWRLWLCDLEESRISQKRKMCVLHGDLMPGHSELWTIMTWLSEHRDESREILLSLALPEMQGLLCSCSGLQWALLFRFFLPPQSQGETTHCLTVPQVLPFKNSRCPRWVFYKCLCYISGTFFFFLVYGYRNPCFPITPYSRHSGHCPTLTSFSANDFCIFEVLGSQLLY